MSYCGVLDLLVHKPTNVQVLGTSSTSLRVTWDTANTSLTSSLSSSSSAAAAAAVSYYRVLLYKVNNEARAELDMTVQQQRAIITDLCKFCEYNVRVIAYNEHGVSHSSDEVTGRTLSDGKFFTASRVVARNLL